VIRLSDANGCIGMTERLGREFGFWDAPDQFCQDGLVATVYTW